jgi:hypothetical protein
MGRAIHGLMKKNWPPMNADERRLKTSLVSRLMADVAYALVRAASRNFRRQLEQMKRLEDCRREFFSRPLPLGRGSVRVPPANPDCQGGDY